MLRTFPLKASLLIFCTALLSCTYLKYTAVQENYSRLQNIDPSQANLKHMLDRDTYFVYGKTLDKFHEYTHAEMAVAAYSSKFKKHERVDTMYLSGAGTHYGLNLPEGSFDLLVYADNNHNRVFENHEVIGRRSLVLQNGDLPDKVFGGEDITLNDAEFIAWADTIKPPAKKVIQNSLFYPSGTIRQLSDPIFDENMSVLGMYDPASFLEQAPTMFYALEEDASYKIPVVFVHGIGGSVRSFEPFLQRLDRSRYKPWFFYYPSGGDLDQLASFFYDIFLSGKVIPLSDMPMIVISHSMGGIVVREAFNKYQNKSRENKVRLWISLASPLGGHPAAESGVKHGLIVLPAWRDLNPHGEYIHNLYRNPLPEFIDHQLYYAYETAQDLQSDKGSDGVVPLSSQKYPMAQQQAQNVLGFEATHTGILKNEAVLQQVATQISKVPNMFPSDHLAILDQGGFDLPLSDDYSPQARYFIRTVGRYIVALAKGDVSPFHPTQEHFVEVVNGERTDAQGMEKDYVRFLKEYQDYLNRKRES